MNTTELILHMPKETKIAVLKDFLKENNLIHFFSLAKLLMETPISLGGLESEIIESIHQEYLDSMDEDTYNKIGKYADPNYTADPDESVNE